MKIALAGAGGTGKGTLGLLLSKKYGVPFIPSHISDTGKMMGMSNYMDVPTKEKALAFQYSIMLGQIYQERSLQIAKMSYIAERSVYDYIPYFLEKNLDDQTYLDIIYDWGSHNYDAIIFLPPEFEPADKDSNTWKERDTEKRKKTSQTILNHMFIHFPNDDMILSVSGSTQERVVQVNDFVLKNKLLYL